MKTLPGLTLLTLAFALTLVGAQETATTRKTVGERRGDAAYGAFQRGYFLTALGLALERAQGGDAAAQTLIAEIYADGLGVPRDMEQAAFWYGQAAEQGNAIAQLKYALLLIGGRHVAADRDRAKALMKSAADSGNALAQFNYAQLLLKDRPGVEGVRQALAPMRCAADAGVADAQFALALIHARGAGIDDPDPRVARNWMVRAARGGFDAAQLNLAVWLIDGIGGEKNYKAGFGWMRRAATTGNVVAQNRLSHLYIHAIGTRPDPIEAAKWYILSRQAGLDDAGLEDFFQGLTADQRKQAHKAANGFVAEPAGW